MKNQEILKEAVKAQKDFVYDKKVDVDGYQIWYCHNPGTRIYSFEMIFGHEGIYVNGDIDSLVWEHRTGLDFLANSEVGDYIYRKLGAIYKDKLDVDGDKVNRFLAEQMVQWLYDDWEYCGDVPIPWKEPCQWDEAPALQQIMEFYETHELCDVGYRAWELYLDMQDREFNDLRTVRQTAYDYDGNCKCDFSKPTWGVMFSMYMACYAAKRIKEQENEEQNSSGNIRHN